MIEQVKAYMEKWNMVEEGMTVFAAVSGGADSVCLCLILSELSIKMGFHLEVIHVEHGIRGEESRKDAEFVHEFCKKLGLPFHMKNVKVPQYAAEHHMSEEEAARFLRYRAFEDCVLSAPGARVALAHHMEDNAETILLQMIRGSGIDGLCGIRPVREGKDCLYIRPLLSCNRKDIETFLEDRGQEFCQDQTNHELLYSRNRIRHLVLPELERINSQAVNHINAAASDIGELRDYLDIETQKAWEQLVWRKGNDVLLDVSGLEKLPEAVRLRLIHRALADASGAKKDIARPHLKAVESLLEMQTGRRISLPNGLTAVRSYGNIILSHDRGQPSDFFREISAEQLDTLREGNLPGGLTVETPRGSLVLKIFSFDGKISEIPRKMYTKCMDYDKIKKGFSIRNRRPGDYFILDDSGHKKKLADYFITEKIPAAERGRYILLAQEQEILWIEGGRIGASVMVRETTKDILEITMNYRRRNQ